MLYGYAGHMLRIDLSTGTIKKDPLEAGMGGRIYQRTGIPFRRKTGLSSPWGR